ncbi:hypothetical protein M378DRAFT_19184 [Amanita muscaria Koide BX008]|uniref:F-box protein n=1 Tax=Amanita muscaria (strain Koide BX008) TaxID=946122 RepID=A0A0C2WC23_AMAMK|nr:hypothetical protein M378DRAFT_19184 [Amanita muscaria Koide BX008]
MFLSYPPIWASLKLSDGYYDLNPLSNPLTRSESYAKEINRRLALYLERSGEYPLTFDVLLWSDHNKSFTMVALEMLSACSHRWQTAKFQLFCDWPVDGILECEGNLPNLEWLEIRVVFLYRHARGIFRETPRLTHAYIGPWAKTYGWIIPWTQLTELILTLNEDLVIEDGDVPNFLPMLHNIKELRIRLSYGEVGFGDDFPQFAPTPLNQLRVLEVPHPALLSWFEAPSLCEIYLADHQQNHGGPLDVEGEISSLIQRSSCRIRKLSFQSGREFYVGTLKDVEELVINYRHSEGIRSCIDVSSLPKLRLLTIICPVDEDFESSMDSLTSALMSASERSPGTSSLERVMVEVHCDHEEPRIPESLLEIVEEWPVVVFRQL